MKNEEMPKLTRGQAVVLTAATLPMVATGVAGGWGTYANVLVEFGRSETAFGVVAAGEGVTLILALVMVGLTMLGQSAPLAVRVGLWAAPLAAAGIGLAVADTATEAVVYGLTPMGMCAAAEGMGLLARRIVVYRTGVDMEARRRNAETVQLLAYHRARANNHPDAKVRKRSERASWRLARRVGVGDNELGAQLVDVQRERLRNGADDALLGMYGGPARPALPPVEEEPPAPVVEEPTKTLAEVLDDVGWLAPVVTTERVDVAPRQVVTELPAWTTVGPFRDDALQLDAKPAALPAEEGREVVTEKVTLTPSDLRRKARAMHRQVVADGGRGVTIDQLRAELGLSRRDAAELRREVVQGVAS